jgi:hypothetical protein
MQNNYRVNIMEDKSNSITELFKFKPETEGRNYVPIVYNDKYDISFWGLENWHPFDTKKWRKIHTKLEDYFQVFSLTKLNIDI